MNKKNAAIYIVLAMVLFFGVRQVYKPEAVYRQNVQVQAEARSPLSASTSTLGQKTASVDLGAATKLPAPQVSDVKPTEQAGSSTAKNSGVILLEMAFTSQSPFGEWGDQRQQDGCEEASALMAVHWAKGLRTLTKAEAKKEILAITAFEEKIYHNYVDTSAAGTLKIIIKEYFNYQNALLKDGSDIEAIKRELADGNALILPMDGKKLKNPNFKNGGPDRHNIVIRGYDPATKEFITNDPGTRKGEGYRYPEKIIESAWRDYPSGDHLPIVGSKKNMIVVMPDVINE